MLPELHLLSSFDSFELKISSSNRAANLCCTNRFLMGSCRYRELAMFCLEQYVGAGLSFATRYCKDSVGIKGMNQNTYQVWRVIVLNFVFLKKKARLR